MKILIILLSFFLIISCDNFSEQESETCENKICEENQVCKVIDEEASCLCKENFQLEDNSCKKMPIECKVDCKTWEECNTEIGKCILKESNCNLDSDCNDEEFCENIETHECTAKCKNNSDCLNAGEICNNNGKCKEVFICSSDESCYENDSSWDKVTNPVICISGECTAKPCRVNDDCHNNKVCNFGKCEKSPDCSLLDKVEITSIVSTISEGSSKKIKLATFDINGKNLNLNEEITWASSKPSIIEIDNQGNILGKDISGISEITASVCNKQTQALSVENFKTIQSGKLRILTLGLDETRLKDVSVKIGERDELTDENGIVLINNSENLNTIMITKEGYNAQSFISVSEKDLIIYLHKEDNKNKAGGIKGEFNFDHESIANNGSVKLGFSGSSISGSFIDFNFESFLGLGITREVNFAGNETSFPLSSGIQFIMGETVVSQEYKVVSSQGDKYFWGLGGRTTMANVFSIISVILSSDEVNQASQEFLTIVAPIIETFNHSLSAKQNVKLCDKVEDTDDINSNQDLTELIPDFNSECFTELNMNLNQELSLSSNIKFPSLPSIESSKTTSIVVIASSILENKELIVTGLTGVGDKAKEGDVKDGKVDDINFSYSPQYSNMLNNSSSLVITTFQDEANKPNKGLTRLSSIIRFYEDTEIEENLDFSNQEFLALAENASFSNNTVSFSAILGASLYRLDIKDINGKVWSIYSATTEIPLENKPNGFSQISSILVHVINIEYNTASISYAELLKINSTNLNDLSKLVKKYSSFEIDLANK